MCKKSTVYCCSPKVKEQASLVKIRYLITVYYSLCVILLQHIKIPV